MYAPITWNERWMNGELSEECIKDCSSTGDVSEAVTYWRNTLNFEVPEEYARQWLREFGAWEPEELRDATQEWLADRVLWIFAGDAFEAIQRGEEPLYYLGS